MAPRLIADNIAELLPMHRAPGDHVSTIVNRICVKLGKFDEDRERPAQIQFEVGNTFEDFMADRLAARFARDNPSRYIHGLELGRDDITGNVDLFDTEDFVIEECKFTKMSIRHSYDNGIEGDKFWHYWVQIKAYCWMIGCNTGRLHICFVNGNWKHGKDDPIGFSYQYRAWEWTWTDQELANNWRMILNNR